MGNIIVRSSQTGLAINDGPSVLGERAARIPVGGKIRSGIKVLTAAARKLKGAQEIYDAGVQAGSTWDQIEKAIRERCNPQRSPLTPRNVPYFTVRRADFTVPETADRIMEIYGEELDGVRRLLRFPVIFATDSWQANMPHALRAYTASQLKYWSEYTADGDRICMTKATIQVDSRSRRAHRPFGGRPNVPRPDTGGVCDPDQCPEYQARKCTLSGSLLFFIPGIPGSSAIELPTTSYYSLQQARQKMEMVAYLRGGRISGTHDGQPIFYLTKSEEEVSMIDSETGQPRRVKQFLVSLEANIDMQRVFRAAEVRRLEAGAAGERAAAALTLQDDLPEDDLPLEDEDTSDQPETETGAADDVETIKALRRDVADLLEKAEISPALFSDWMTDESENPDWGRCSAGLTQAKNELTKALAGDIQQWKAERDLDTPF
ncbi:hypothetical protein BN2364_4018 [Alloalcanivorax xenomutans]|uniref:recombination directionality factor n=1 Tax=Alloalcanivorax xenomutans TaxID=1094342 RepID=UPI0006D5C78E|nr:hypothetical protein [Alloalcanivorax xenomutans]CUR48459.1 hypothetical protein BN2364_4018 [Alloalcanivorax xenomutans]